jgi:hypothetical protein
MDASGDLLSTMRDRLRIAQAGMDDTRQDELDDLKFYAGSPSNQWQWPNDVLSTRGSVQGQTINARPCLTINKLPQHVKQVTNEQRQNRPSGKVIPVDDDADIEVAEIFEGMIRHIEYISDADVAYDTACENQVIYGEGYIRVLTDYCSEDSFDQDIKIGRIRNAFSVYMDPTIQDPCGADAEWCFVTQDMSHEEYKRSFPDAQPVSTLLSSGVGDESLSDWIEEETVRIAEYFYNEYTPDTLNEYPDGTSAFSSDPKNKLLMKQFGQPKRSRKAQRKTVMWCKTNGYEILEKTQWPGKWIPVVRVIGNEFEIEGRIWISGLVRNAKDAQRMYNYWVSQEAEMLALAPKAPFIGYSGQFEGYEDKWKTANVQNWPYLEVNADVTDGLGNLAPLPQRAQPPAPQNGILQAKMGASDDIKSSTGQYDASLGNQSNEVSGKAILAREKQSDVGTYHYVDNLARAIRHITRQCVDLIPKIYDTHRIARTIGLDGDVKMAKINPQQDEAVKTIRDPQTNAVIEKIYNPTVGTYDVMVTTGPSYMTKRQEGAEWMSNALQAWPQGWQIFGDLAVKSMDVAYAQEIADRIRRTIPPQIIGDSEDTPEVAQLKQQNQQLTQMVQQMHGMLSNMDQSFEAQELKIKEFDAETRRIAAVAPEADIETMHEIAAGTVDAALNLHLPDAVPAAGALMPPPSSPAPAAIAPAMGQ